MLRTDDSPITYQLKRTWRRRSIMLRIDPAGTVTVLAPRFAPTHSIERYIHDQSGWIRQKLKTFQVLRGQHPSKRFVSGEMFPVWGVELPILVTADPNLKKGYCQTIDGQLEVLVRDTTHAQPVKDALRDWYRRLTEERLRELVPFWAARLRVIPGKVTVANQRRRWGSCSPKGDLRFNGRLSMMPPAMLESVVVHELAHIKEHNHSKRFWTLVESALPDYKERRRWLRKNGAPLGLDYNEA